MFYIVLWMFLCIVIMSISLSISVNNGDDKYKPTFWVILSAITFGMFSPVIILWSCFKVSLDVDGQETFYISPNETFTYQVQPKDDE